MQGKEICEVPMAITLGDGTEQEVILKVSEANKKVEKAKKVIALDCDKTTIIGHLHSYLRNKKFLSSNDEVRENHIESFIQEQGGLRNGEKLQEIIDKAFKSGFAVNIVSHSSFPSAIALMLKRLIPEYAGKMTIICCSDTCLQEAHNKSPLLEHLKKIYNIKEKKDIYLIDDNSENCSNTTSDGFSAIHAEVDKDEYLSEMEDVIKGKFQQKTFDEQPVAQMAAPANGFILKAPLLNRKRRTTEPSPQGSLVDVKGRNDPLEGANSTR